MWFLWVWGFCAASGSWLGDEDCEWVSASVVFRFLLGSLGLVGGRCVAPLSVLGVVVWGCFGVCLVVWRVFVVCFGVVLVLFSY